MSSASTLARKRGRSSIWIMTAASLIALFVVAVVFTHSSSTEAGADTERIETGAVYIQGDSLPALLATGQDPAVGMSVPEVSGKSFDGTKVLVVAAHWCPHCQAEIPRLQEWIDQRGMTKGVELVTVSTSADPGQPNYPPSQWLEREGWTAPVIADNASGATSEVLWDVGLSLLRVRKRRRHGPLALCG